MTCPVDKLFTNPTPIAIGYKTQADDDFTYMNTHADEPVIAIRNLLEAWFQHIPLDSKLDLAQRFRSIRPSQHQGAFWELFLHELFRTMGFAIETHPQTLGKNSRPDLLLLRDGVPYAVVEARLAGLPSDAEVAAQRLKAELQDALNQVHSPNFFLMIEELECSPKRPSFKHLRADLEGWLASLNYDDMTEHVGRVEDSRPQFEWSQDGWFLRLNVLPRSVETRGKPGIRSVGSTGFDIQWSNSVGEIRLALKDKSSKYGELGVPFLIAVNHLGMHCDHSDWSDALYGSQAVHVYFNGDQISHQHPFRKNDGFWIGKEGAQNRQVSAVLGGWRISPWTIGAHPVQIYDHFSPVLSLGSEVSLPRWFVPLGQGELKLRTGPSAAEILRIPEGWPGELQRAQVSADKGTE